MQKLLFWRQAQVPVRSAYSHLVQRRYKDETVCSWGVKVRAGTPPPLLHTAGAITGLGAPA